MEKTRQRKTVLLSFGIATIILLMSFTSAVSFYTVRSTQATTVSPLFHRRLENVLHQEKNTAFSSLYIGKDQPVQIPLPTKNILTEEILNQLSDKSVKEQVRLLNNDLSQKWDSLLVMAKNNLAEINRIIRQDYNLYQNYLLKYSEFSKQEAQNHLSDLIRGIDLYNLQQNNPVQTGSPVSANITTGFLCNLTSGQFCQVTSQPICQITTQPICSLTKGFFCWTIYGPICPTTGIKCHPPTSRPALCSIFAAAGKILKTIILVLLLATVIFVPIAILSLVFITVFNPDRCEQLHEQITLRFNCTTPS